MNTTIKQDDTPRRLSRLPRRQVIITLSVVMLAVFLASLDQTVVATAMPRIIADLGGFTQYTWVSTAYILASTVAVPVTGRLIDMYGRKWFYVAGILIFIVGSALSGLSQSMTQLIAFRGFQGIGAGMMMANSFTIVGDLFPPAERGKYQGFITGVFGVSSVIGPTLGGFITDTFTWHWIFYLNVPLGLLVIALFIRFFPHMRPDSRHHQIDYLGVAALILTVVPMLLAFTWGGVDYAWASPVIIGMFVFSFLMGVSFLLIERKCQEPIIPLWLFRNRIVAISQAVTFFTGIAMFGSFIFIPLYFQGVMGMTAMASGGFMTPMMLGVVGGSIISGQVLARTGGHYRRQSITGLFLMGIGMWLLTTMNTETTYARAVMGIVVMGFGLGSIMPLYTIAVQNAVPYEFMGVATATNIFFRSVGGALGLAVLGSTMSNRFASEFIKQIPAAVSEVIPAEQMSSLLHNPQALVNPQAQAELYALFAQSGANGAALYEQLLYTMRSSLSVALSEVFAVGLIAIGIAFVINLFIKEIPLRKHN